MKTAILIVALLFGALPVLAAGGETIKVEALFQNKAMVSINGKRHLMKAGQQIDGITLVSASGRGALFRFADGEERHMDVNQQIGHGFSKRKKQKLTLYPTANGMFLLDGSINGRPTRFLLDTGATFIALSQDEAESLAIAYESEARMMIQTASERVPAWQVTLGRVKVGDIVVPNVQAVVLQGNSPSPALLGMSFLSHVNMQRNGAAMMLEQKY